MLPEMPYQSQGEIDIQLDLENHVWDRAPYIEFFLKQSELVRKMHECIEDIQIGARDEERLDVFRAKKQRAPILLFVHGGWWRLGTRKWFSFCANGLCERGYTVLMTDYALCPKVRIPDITAATRLAVRWAYDNAEQINGDRNRIFVAGHSAGGHQAAMMAVTNWTRDYGLPADVIKAAVPISGLFDLRPFQMCWLQPKLQLTLETALNESPLFQVPDRAPPLLIALGAEESIEFHRQAETFAKAWREKGHEADYLDVAGEDHTTNVHRLGDPDSELCSAIAKFLDRC